MTLEALLRQDVPPPILGIQPQNADSPEDALAVARLLPALRAPIWTAELYAASILTEFLRSVRYQHQSFSVTELPPSAHPLIREYIHPAVDVVNRIMLCDEAPSRMRIRQEHALGYGSACFSILFDGASPLHDSVQTSARSRVLDTSQEQCCCLVIFKDQGSLDPQQWIRDSESWFEPPESPATGSFRPRDFLANVYVLSARYPAKYVFVTDFQISIGIYVWGDFFKNVYRPWIYHCFQPVTFYSANPRHRPQPIRFSLTQLLCTILENDGLLKDRPLYQASHAYPGPLNNPEMPKPSREKLIRTARSFNDWDVCEMKADKSLYLDFVAWHRYIATLGSREGMKIGTFLRSAPKDFHSAMIPHRSPRTIPRLPQATIDIAHRYTRPRSLLLDDLLQRPFSVEIIEIIRRKRNTWSQVFKVRVRSNADHSTSSDILLPSLCLKVYDERFFAILDETMFGGPLEYFNPASELVQREEGAYDAMRGFQGSFIPHCYGFHKFMYPSGWESYGMLSEFIPGSTIAREIIDDLPSDHVRSFIIHLRHAVRALRYSDVFQTDWSCGQIICLATNSGGPVPVLIDFAFAVLSQAGYDARPSYDVAHVRNLLKSVRVSGEVLDELWTEPDFYEQ